MAGLLAWSSSASRAAGSRWSLPAPFRRVRSWLPFVLTLGACDPEQDAARSATETPRAPAALPARAAAPAPRPDPSASCEHERKRLLQVPGLPGAPKFEA